MDTSNVKEKKKRKMEDVNEIEYHEEHNKVEKSKKKKKKDAPNSDNFLEEVDESVITSVEESPKKKKKKKSEKIKNEDDEEIQGLDSTSDNLSLYIPNVSTMAIECSKEKTAADYVLKERTSLLGEALKQLKPSKKAYRSEFSMLDFQQIAESFPDKTPEECQSEIKALIDKTIKIKCLHQIIEETMNELPRRGRALTAFTRFVSRNRDKVNEEAKKFKGENRLAVASRMWKELSVDEQQAYSHIESSSPSKLLGKTPVEVFAAAKKSKDPSLHIKDIRDKWANLALSKKMKFIKKSLELRMKLNENMEDDDDEECEGGDEASKKKIKGPSKIEIEEYLKFMKMPKCPSKSAAFYHYEENIKKSDAPQKSYLVDAMSCFKKLSKEDQEFWTDKQKTAKKMYYEEIEHWKETQDVVTLYAYQLYDEARKLKAPKKPKGNTKKQTLINDVSKLHSVEMPLGKVVFRDEPSTPPLTPLQLFIKDVERQTSKKLTVGEAKKRFVRLDKEKKDSYFDKCNQILKAYTEGLKAYVGGMGEEQRKLFLGLNRVKYMKLLFTDIFEELYPHFEYPVYVSVGAGETNTPKSKSLSKVNRHRDDDLEDEDEDETEKISPVKNSKGTKMKLASPSKSYATKDSLRAKGRDDSEESEEEEFSVKVKQQKQGVSSSKLQKKKSKKSLINEEENFTSDSESDSASTESEKKSKEVTTKKPTAPKSSKEDDSDSDSEGMEGLEKWMNASVGSKKFDVDTDSDSSGI